jgi:hypothetical protein
LDDFVYRKLWGISPQQSIEKDMRYIQEFRRLTSDGKEKRGEVAR